LAHYVFIARDNQLSLAQDIRLAFDNRKAPDYSEPYTLAHGRIESCSIWTSTLLNDYLEFPFVGQIFATGLIKSISKDSVSSTIEKLARNVRRVFDYLRRTDNSRKVVLRCRSQEV
jgi:hypothetical protein